MSGSMGNMAFGTPEQGLPDTIMSLKTVHRMLPLVQRVVQDILDHQQTIERLQPELDGLQRDRRELSWPERQRRYRLQEEFEFASNQLSDHIEELSGLGVFMLDLKQGRVGFPTLVNNRRAFFSWKPGEDGLRSWHFAEESIRRPIPAAWLKEISMSSTAI